MPIRVPVPPRERNRTPPDRHSNTAEPRTAPSHSTPSHTAIVATHPGRLTPDSPHPITCMSRQRESSLLYLCIAFAFFHCTHTTTTTTIATTTNSVHGGSLVSFPMSSTGAWGFLLRAPTGLGCGAGLFHVFYGALHCHFRGDGFTRKRFLIAAGISRIDTVLCSAPSRVVLI